MLLRSSARLFQLCAPLRRPIGVRHQAGIADRFFSLSTDGGEGDSEDLTGPAAAAKAARAYTSTPMPDDQFTFMRNVLAAPSPVGMEASMTRGVLEDRFNELTSTHSALNGWVHRTFKGNAGTVWETSSKSSDNPDKLNVMIIGHADKIRMQVRSIGKDGKIWINTDSFLPLTLLGNHCRIFSAKPETHGKGQEEYQSIDATAEAVGAIHFASAAIRNGKEGLQQKDIYLELGLTGEDRREQVEALGIRVGDPVLLNRPIERCVAPNSFSGAYLDNGLGCFVTAEVARLVAERNPTLAEDINCQFAFCSYEEIGRYGSRVIVSECKPDVLIAVDVNHDFESAPRVSSERFPPLTMGLGMTLGFGSIASEHLNSIITHAAESRGIPVQRDVNGRDTGTDAMAGVFGNVDCAATTVGFPIRNMHTISELGHTGDLLATIEALYATLEDLQASKTRPEDLRHGHPRLDRATEATNDSS